MTWLFGRWRTLAVAIVASTLAVGIGVWVSSPATPPATPLAHTLATLDTTTMTLERAPFCDRVTGADVAAALGAAPTAETAWKNGDKVPLGSTTDVAHEYGCQWSTADHAAAAWIFAPPVTVAEADTLIDAATKVEGCTPIAGAPAFGSPSVALTCGGTVSYRGLYGDAWLVCTLGGPAAVAEVTATAPRWCASVALAAQATAAPAADS